jgi:hypothetical protein
MRSARLAAASALMALTPALLPAQQILGRSEEVFTWSDRVARAAWFRFFAPMGDITVTAGSGDRVEVRAEKVLRRGRVDDIAFAVVRSGDGITICAIYEDEDDCDEDGLHRRWTNWSRSRTYPGLAVTIRLPAGVRVRAQSGNGDVSVTGAGDEVIATSGNGRVRVNGSGGDVNASSGNGEVTVEGARGAVRANSGNGDVTVSTTRGPVQANSGNGDLYITMDALPSEEDMTFNTGNGRIRLMLPANFSGEIDASSGNGSVVSDFPIQVTGRISRTRVRGTIGDGGGRRVRMTSGNGTIELRKRAT